MTSKCKTCGHIEKEHRWIVAGTKNKVIGKCHHSAICPCEKFIPEDETAMPGSSVIQSKEKKGCGKYFPNKTKFRKSKDKLVCGREYRGGKKRLCNDCNGEKSFKHPCGGYYDCPLCLNQSPRSAELIKDQSSGVLVKTSGKASGDNTRR